MDLKKKAAAEAIKMIEENMIVGFGAGSSIAYVIEFLKTRIEEGLQVTILTSSFTTRQLCLQKQLSVASVSDFDVIDIYFDGCDQFDTKLNALKSGGGIHTKEKLLASMAKQFIILGDESKLIQELNTKFPVIIEVLPESLAFITRKIKELFVSITPELRKSINKDGAVITENGNYLIDLWLQSFPEPVALHSGLKALPGVVETSLFTGIVTKAIVATSDGIKVITK